MSQVIMSQVFMSQVFTGYMGALTRKRSQLPWGQGHYLNTRYFSQNYVQIEKYVVIMRQISLVLKAVDMMHCFVTHFAFFEGHGIT